MMGEEYGKNTFLWFNIQLRIIAFLYNFQYCISLFSSFQFKKNPDASKVFCLHFQNRWPSLFDNFFPAVLPNSRKYINTRNSQYIPLLIHCFKKVNVSLNERKNYVFVPYSVPLLFSHIIYYNERTYKPRITRANCTIKLFSS